MLAAGTRLGVYEVIAPIGEGGMGQVYRARDTRLNRDVAIKVLPDLFATDEERRARFEHEAQTLAALNHPHIAQIYGVEGQALVMELVDGEDLAQRIGRGPLAVHDAIDIARQIAEALEAAHDAGIIHRDLKPANVRIRPDGTVKVLDFGLAKAAAPGGPALTNSPTFTSPAMTARGMILGTAAYMSPEQAQGKAVDQRADLWAFGVVLFEMLTGKPMHAGDNVSSVLASVLRDEPAWSALPPDLPPRIHRLLRRCLQKDPRLRLRHAGDARLELIDDEPEATTHGARSSSSWSRYGLIAAATAVVAALGGFVLGTQRVANTPQIQLRKWVIAQDVPRDDWDPNDAPAISPDGRRVAYTDGTRLRIRDLTTIQATEITTTSVPFGPFWSPDAAVVAYALDQRSLWKVTAAGGTPSKICDLPPGVVFGAAWRPDHSIVVNMAYGPTAGELFIVRDEGGVPQRLPTANAEPAFWLRGLPDGSYTYQTYRDGKYETVIDGGGKERKVLALPSPHQGAAYSPTGHLIFAGARAPGIWAIPFALETHTITGDAFRIAEAGTGPSASSDGTLAYGRAGGGLRQLTWMDRDGNMRGQIGQAQEGIRSPHLSPDGKRVAVEGKENGAWSIWVHEVERPVKTRLTFSPSDSQPAWQGQSPRLTFGRDWDIFSVGLDGGEPTVVVKGAQPQYDPASSRDGRHFVFGQFEQQTMSDIWMMESGQTAVPILQTRFNESLPALTSDARLIAYVSDETGTSQVFVRPFPKGEGKVQASLNTGDSPVWSPRGDEIFFVEGTALMAAAVHTSPTLRIDAPRSLFTFEPGAPQTRRFDTLDGKQFVVIHTVKPAQSGVAIVQNWFSEFSRR